MPTFALVDSNNFYVSCEYVVDPSLMGVAVGVLSNNDRCLVARSNEIKAPGVRMGQPLFRVRKLIYRERVWVFSLNYTLYGDMSRRVLSILESRRHASSAIRPTTRSLTLATSAGTCLTSAIGSVRWSCAGPSFRPVSGSSRPRRSPSSPIIWAKKRSELDGVCDLRDPDRRSALLPTTPVGKVRGIGGASVRKLKRLGVETVDQLASMGQDVARRVLTVVGARTVQELRGTSCLPLAMVEPTRKGIASPAFGEPVTSWPAMQAALST